jgi:opacity protein-like surface antigen
VPAVHRVAAACASALLFAAVAAAQSPPESSEVRSSEKVQLGAGIVAGVPVGDFADNVESAGGLFAGFDIRLRSSIFSVGGEIAWLLYGDTSRTVDLGPLVPEIPGASIKVNTENQLLMVHARVRAQRPAGRWRPYADGVVGFNRIYTTTSIEGGVDCPGDAPGCVPIDAPGSTNASDYVLSYGGGAGVTFRFKRHPTKMSPRLDLSLRYLRGGEASYLPEGGIRVDGGVAVLEISHSRTDMVLLYIGITIGR